MAEHTRDQASAAIDDRAARANARASSAAEMFTPEFKAAEAKRQEAARAAEAAANRYSEYDRYVAEVLVYNQERNQDQRIGAVHPFQETMGLEEWKVAYGFTEPEEMDAGENDAWMSDQPEPEEVQDEPTEGPVPTGRKSLAEAVSDHLGDQPAEPVNVMGGAVLLRWVLTPAEEGNDWVFGMSVERELDEMPDAVFVNVNQAMLRSWRNEPKGTNTLERFAAGLIEKLADATAEDLTDSAVAALHRITDGDLRGVSSLRAVPTETAIGDDDGPVNGVEGTD